MLAARGGELEFTLARARGKVTLSGRTFATSRKIPEQVFATGQHLVVEDLLDDDLALLHSGTVALGIRHVLCTPLRLVRYVERADEKPADETIGVLYLDSRERGALRAASRSTLETVGRAALAIENARLYRQGLDKASRQELKVAAAIQRALLRRRVSTDCFARRWPLVTLSGRRRTSSTWITDRPVRVHRRRCGGAGSPAALRRGRALHVQPSLPIKVSRRRGRAFEPRPVPAGVEKSS
jgi:hypothetical protein